jgi:hypothetical protein
MCLRCHAGALSFLLESWQDAIGHHSKEFVMRVRAVNPEQFGSTLAQVDSSVAAGIVKRLPWREIVKDSLLFGLLRAAIAVSHSELLAYVDDIAEEYEKSKAAANTAKTK